jgi:EpsI family protein
MRPQFPLAAVAVGLLLPGAYLNGWLPRGSAPAGAPRFTVPARVGAWTAVSEERLDARSQSFLDPSAYALRSYEAPGRTPIHVYVGFYAGRASSAKNAHNPEICYPSSGWEPMETRSLELQASRGDASDSFRATLLDMRRGVLNELVLYWFQPAERWPHGRIVEELLYVYDAMAGRPQYAFVRLVGQVLPGSDRPGIVADLREFAGELAWPVRDALSAPEAGAMDSAPLRSRGGERDG